MVDYVMNVDCVTSRGKNSNLMSFSKSNAAFIS